MSSSIPLTIAEAIQTASINRHPSVTRDIAPSTSADTKIPVQEQQQQRVPPSSPSAALEENDEDNGDDDEEEEEEIPYSVIKPIRRKPAFPPLPDLRFEQSYLASIRGAESWTQVGYITVRDQVSFLRVSGDGCGRRN